MKKRNKYTYIALMESFKGHQEIETYRKLKIQILWKITLSKSG